jgi:hypothetical protein
VASQWCLGVIVFGVGGTIAYMLVFNRRARQGLHDLVCGTYVVRLQGALVAGFPSTPRFHLVVSSVLVGVLVVGGIVAAYFATTGSLVRLHAIREALRQDTRFFSVGVQDFTFHATGRKTVRSLQIQVWFRGVPSSVERSQVTTELAREVLRVAGSVNEYDLLVVSLSSAYDLGIASGSMQYVDSQPPAVWRQRTSESAR